MSGRIVSVGMYMSCVGECGVVHVGVVASVMCLLADVCVACVWVCRVLLRRWVDDRDCCVVSAWAVQRRWRRRVHGVSQWTFRRHDRAVVVAVQWTVSIGLQLRQRLGVGHRKRVPCGHFQRRRCRRVQSVCTRTVRRDVSDEHVGVLGTVQRGSLRCGREADDGVV